MKNYSYLSIDRPVIDDPSSLRFTAKITDLANRVVGNDGVSIADRDGATRVVGNPRFKLLFPLQLNLLYRSAVTDSRNKSSSFGMAAAKLENSDEFYDELTGLYAKYDGIGPDQLSLFFDTVVQGDKPGYQLGETQIDLQPSLGQAEASFLATESQVCSRGLIKVASRIAQVQSPHVNTVPLIRLESGLSELSIEKFVQELRKLLPIRLILGELGIDGVDRRSRAISPQRLGNRL